MTRDTTDARGSRSRRLRLPLRRPLIACLVAALLAIMAGAIVATRDDQQARYGSRAAQLAELRGLVGENGFFMRPGLLADRGSSWAASAYGLPALAATTGDKLTLVDAAALLESLESQIDSEPVWGRWYAVMVERSTGVTLPGAWADGILDESIVASDSAGRVATVAAIADVVAAKALPVSTDQRSIFAAVLSEGSGAGPYSGCRALQAAEALQLDPAGWSTPGVTDVVLPAAFDPAAAMDAYGSLCLAKRLGQPLLESVRQRVLRWLEPQLNMEVAGAEFDAYYVVQGWLAAGGDAARLAGLAQKLRARLDPATGLLRERIVRLGTLESTYYVAVLADTVDAFDDLVDERTLDAVRRLVPELRAKTALTDLLMAAVVLRSAGKPDAALEAEAADIAIHWLADGITRETVASAARVMLLLQQIGRPVPKAHAITFSVSGVEDRFLAWTLLGIAHHLDNGAEVRRQFAGSIAEAGSALTNPNQLMVKEVVAAAAVPGSGLDRNHLPEPLATWASAIQGCDGFQTLYRPILDESRCSLEATVQMLNAGLDSS